VQLLLKWQSCMSTMVGAQSYEFAMKWVLSSDNNHTSTTTDYFPILTQMTKYTHTVCLMTSMFSWVAATCKMNAGGSTDKRTSDFGLIDSIIHCHISNKNTTDLKYIFRNKCIQNLQNCSALNELRCMHA